MAGKCWNDKFSKIIFYLTFIRKLKKDNSFEKTLKVVESLLPNKCDNIYNRYKQQLDEIEKYEGFMQNIIKSLIKGYIFTS
jgi:hypothetical protein